MRVGYCITVQNDEDWDRFEAEEQLRGEAGDRQLKDPGLGMTHNLGGAPGRCVSFVSLVGS